MSFQVIQPIHVIHVNSCHSCQLMSFDSRLFRKFNKLVGVGAGLTLVEQNCVESHFRVNRT
jgi:hypothetical protein